MALLIVLSVVVICVAIYVGLAWYASSEGDAERERRHKHPKDE